MTTPAPTHDVDMIDVACDDFQPSPTSLNAAATTPLLTKPEPSDTPPAELPRSSPDAAATPPRKTMNPIRILRSHVLQEARNAVAFNVPSPTPAAATKASASYDVTLPPDAVPSSQAVLTTDHHLPRKTGPRPKAFQRTDHHSPGKTGPRPKTEDVPANQQRPLLAPVLVSDQR
ncbi:hypothetical protein H310_15314 [Aphanomyces invadans]|uniref:Uncharacterized protein n=1 Tax=Aphanomyces invadans TaxID=157072 RepID=A0A024T8D9_9STRA|nr:hypothetical protein H310_15314 [Aphanomyces invadans]ETV89846.1 hypothetical protein H310_15314 [Aphanomyces invadans]|eukprot:XP_008881521.1 hypothetical protein H310_15314 [Aphanomyces invadans]